MAEIEHEHRINRGYVYSSAFQSDEAAEAVVSRAQSVSENTRVVIFVTGAYQRSWVANVAAIGNAACFVEPLEATALFVICAASQALTAALHSTDRQQNIKRSVCIMIIAAVFGGHSSFFSGALSLQYAARYAILASLSGGCRSGRCCSDCGILSRVRPNGLWNPTFLDPVDTFRLDGYFVLLQGLKVPFKRRYTPTPAETNPLATTSSTMASHGFTGLTIAEALQIVRLPQWKWHEGFYR